MALRDTVVEYTDKERDSLDRPITITTGKAGSKDRETANFNPNPDTEMGAFRDVLPESQAKNLAQNYPNSWKIVGKKGQPIAAAENLPDSEGESEDVEDDYPEVVRVAVDSIDGAEKHKYAEGYANYLLYGLDKPQKPGRVSAENIAEIEAAVSEAVEASKSED